MSSDSAKVFRILARELGQQHWWPAESPFEVMVGAMLVQNTAWKNVERALDNLRAADLLAPLRLAAVAEEELAELIRPAGYYRLKAKRLRHLLAFVIERFEGSIDAMRAVPLEVMRRDLLAIHALGPKRPTRFSTTRSIIRR